MLPGGAKPAPWGAPNVIPPACQGLGSGMPVISMVGKTVNVLTAFDQPFKTGPLIDQNGHYARFSIQMNKPMFEYIDTNALYSKAGQKQFNDAIDFPVGQVTGGTTGTIGAIMVKSSWRVLTDKDDRKQFHAIGALVYTPPSENPKIDESCKKQTLGMVGLHIGHKTKSDPQWLWSTFEHVRNVPTVDDIKAHKASGTYNFYNAGLRREAMPAQRAAAAAVGSQQAAVPRRLPQPDRARDPAHAGRDRSQQRLPGDPQGHGVGELRIDQHAVADQRLQHHRPDRRAGADLSRQYHARKLHPGPGAGFVLELHPLPQQRDHAAHSGDAVGLHLHFAIGAVSTGGA